MPPLKPRRHPLKWVAVAACLLILAGWAISSSWSFGITTKYAWGLNKVTVRNGVLRLHWDRTTCYVNFSPEYTVNKAPFKVMEPWGDNLVFRWQPFTGPLQGSLDLRVHLSLILILAVGATVFYWRRLAKEFPPGHCLCCGYNLTGADHERCPECGTSCDPEAMARAVPSRWPARLRFVILMTAAAAALILSAWAIDNWGRSSKTASAYTAPTAKSGFGSTQGNSFWMGEGGPNAESDKAFDIAIAYLKKQGKLPRNAMTAMGISTEPKGGWFVAVQPIKPSSGPVIVVEITSSFEIRLSDY